VTISGFPAPADAPIRDPVERALLANEPAPLSIVWKQLAAID
jgi:hypothetical protein